MSTTKRDSDDVLTPAKVDGARRSLPLTASLLDVDQLDDYLVRLLVKALTGSSSSSPNRLSLSFQAPLEAAIHTFTLLASHGQTPAVQVLGLKRNCRHLLIVACLRYLLPCFYRMFQIHVEAHLTHRPANEQEAISLERKRLVLTKLQWVASRILPVVRLGAILGVWSGTCTTADLAMLVTRGSYSTVQQSASPPSLHVDYAHRRWLFAIAWQTLRLFTADIGSLPKLSNLIPYRNLTSSDGAMMCALCHQSPPSTPVETNCGHIYCYLCLYGHRGPCKICGTTVARGRMVR